VQILITSKLTLEKFPVMMKVLGKSKLQARPKKRPGGNGVKLFIRAYLDKSA
jgi:hypothetical protein